MLSSLFSRKPPTVPTAEEAHPGHSSPQFAVSDVHAVNGNRTKEPRPEGLGGTGVSCPIGLDV